MCVFGSKSVVALTVLAVSVLGAKIFTRDGRELPKPPGFGDYSMAVLLGEPLELFVEYSGELRSLSTIKYDLKTHKREPMSKEEWNLTTVRLFLKKPERQQSIYIAMDSHGYTHVSVLVDSLPKINNFSCVLYFTQVLNCTWISPNLANNYTLVLESNDFINDNRNNITICTIASHQAISCVFSFWEPISRFEHGLNIIMEACNPLGCVHPRFDKELVIPIVKMARPELLEVMNIGSRSVSLKWQHTGLELNLTHRVEYLCFGNEPYEVNVSSVQVNIFFNTATIDLELPCANTRYEVRLSSKIKEAIGDKYWSEPASIFFKTAMDTKPNDDPICQYSVGSNKGMLNKTISKLKADMQQQLLKLKERVKSLRNRADALNLRRSSDDETSRRRGRANTN